MDTIKATVYTALSSLTASVSQTADNTFNDLPAVTYRVTQNAPNYDFQKTINLQDVEVTIDIWSESSTNASSLLASTEAKMRAIDLFLTFTADIPNEDGLYHINTRFVGII